MAGKQYTISARIEGKDDFTPAAKSAEKSAKDLVGTLEGGVSGAAEVATGAFGRLGEFLRVGFVAAIAVATAALTGFAALMTKAVPAAAEAETNARRLANALADIGPAADRVVGALTAQAEALQRVTAFEDDAITKGQAFAAAFIKNEETLGAVTQAAVDLAAGLGVDLQTAFELLTKAFQGNTDTLGRYGIVLGETLDPAQKFATLLGLIEQRFGGRAEADAKTYAGALTQLRNAWGNLLETLGTAVTENEAVKASIRSITEFFNSPTAVQGVKNFANEIIRLGGELKKFAVETLPVLQERAGAALAALTTLYNGWAPIIEGIAEKVGQVVSANIRILEGLVEKAGQVFQAIGAVAEGVNEKLTSLGNGIFKVADFFGLVTPEIVKAAEGADQAGTSWDRLGKTIGTVNEEVERVPPAMERARKSFTDLGDQAERSGPTFVSYYEYLARIRGAAGDAGEALDDLGDDVGGAGRPFAEGVGDINAYIEALLQRLVPALQQVGQQAAETAAQVSGVFDRSGDALPDGGTLELGGTRYTPPPRVDPRTGRIYRDGSRLVGSAGGVRNSASNVGVNTSPYSARFLIDTPQYGTIEAFRVTSGGFGPSGAGTSTYGVLPGGRIVPLSL